MFRDLIESGWRGGKLGYGEALAGEAHDFWPGESRAMARATPARQAEFAAGRAAARHALEHFGARAKYNVALERGGAQKGRRGEVALLVQLAAEPTGEVAASVGREPEESEGAEARQRPGVKPPG